MFCGPEMIEDDNSTAYLERARIIDEEEKKQKAKEAAGESQTEDKTEDETEDKNDKKLVGSKTFDLS